MSKKKTNPLEIFLETKKEEEEYEPEPRIRSPTMTNDIDSVAYTTKVRLYEKDPETRRWAKESVESDLRQRGIELNKLSAMQLDKLIEEKIKTTRIPYTFSNYKLKEAGYSMRGGKNTKKRRNRRKTTGKMKKGTNKRRKGRKTRRKKMCKN
jgi:hypothetical protein